MSTLANILFKAKQQTQHIVLPEGTDGRVIQAAMQLESDQIATVSLVGSVPDITTAAKVAGFSVSNIHIIDPSEHQHQSRYGAVLFEARKHKGLSQSDAMKLVQDPLTMGACMVRSGDADGMVAGATHPTADVVRSALQIIGMKKGSKIVSSFFLMEHTLPHQAFQGTAIYADCGMVIDPDADTLACIAMDSADSAADLVEIDPKVALLSFSTAGSAEHSHVDKVRNAGEIISELRPDIKLMTEVQFDAAILPEILQKKAPNIQISAPANVFIFPDLQSGNIGYKIAQRIGGVQAIGPILQGLGRPINDLSRGCSIDDIVNLAAVTSVQAQMNH